VIAFISEFSDDRIYLSKGQLISARFLDRAQTSKSLNLKMKLLSSFVPFAFGSRDPIWAGKMLQSLENAKESWKLNFDLKKEKTGSLGDDDTNFLTFSNDFMELDRSTYFSVDYSATIPVDSWQVVGFEQKKNQTTGASDLTVSWNGQSFVDYRLFTTGGIFVGRNWDNSTEGVIENLEFQTWDFEDECALEQHNCNGNATCTDLEELFECSCKTGFEGDGIDCQGRF
jgi:hypothetical protein